MEKLLLKVLLQPQERQMQPCCNIVTTSLFVFWDLVVVVVAQPVWDLCARRRSSQRESGAGAGEGFVQKAESRPNKCHTAVPVATVKKEEEARTLPQLEQRRRETVAVLRREEGRKRSEWEGDRGGFLVSTTRPRVRPSEHSVQQRLSLSGRRSACVSSAGPILLQR